MEDGDRVALLPLHIATLEGNQPVIDFFLTECGMPVDTCTSDMQFTALHFLALSDQHESRALPIATWLVEEKGADATIRSTLGSTAAETAVTLDKARLHRYLKAQERRQATVKAAAAEGEKAVAAQAMATRMQDAEEAMEALLLELEAEEEAAADKDKKGRRASSGDKKKKKR